MKKASEYSQLKKKYHKSLDELEAYLMQQGYAKGTIEQFKNYTAYFFNWKEQRSLEAITYNTLLIYIDYCSLQNDSTRLINRKLAAIRKYYEYLQHKGSAIKNPASGLFLKGAKKGLPNNLLDKEELQQLYANYQVYDLRTARNKVILSLIINQAVTTGELNRLEPIHIKLNSGKIEIPGSRYSKGRTLKLKASQIIELQQYINKTRPAILKTIKEETIRPARKVKELNLAELERKLFISLNGSLNIKNSLLHFTTSLKRLNESVRDLRQLRQSVIAEWLKTEDVRKVQYKAGHKHVSTTERYQVNNLEDLQEALNNHHPLQ
jgi:integrase/recombinase XerD